MKNVRSNIYTTITSIDIPTDSKKESDEIRVKINTETSFGLITNSGKRVMYKKIRDESYKK